MAKMYKEPSMKINNKKSGKGITYFIDVGSPHPL